MLEIPVSDFKEQSSDFVQNLDLENVNIEIRLTYNIRVNYWFAEFKTNNTYIKSVKLVTNNLLIDQYKATMYEIPGDFMVQRITDDLDKPELTYDNFGIDWGLFYLTSDEVTDYKEENFI